MMTKTLVTKTEAGQVSSLRSFLVSSLRLCRMFETGVKTPFMTGSFFFKVLNVTTTTRIRFILTKPVVVVRC